MSSFEWMELQTLTRDINAARSRLTQARPNKDQREIRALEAEIAAAEVRRDRLIASISSDLAAHPELAARAVAESAAAAGAIEPGPQDDAGPPVPAASAALAEETGPDDGAVPVAAEPVAEPVEPDAAPIVASADAGGKGGSVVWDQLTPKDIDRAQSMIGVRRVETLARHAAELQALELEQGELDALEQAIDAFVRRFRAPPNGDAAAPGSAADIVKLGEERELRAQGRG